MSGSDIKPTDDKASAPSADLPPAGPHAKPELTNPDLTPGTGSLPDADEDSEAGEAASS